MTGDRWLYAWALGYATVGAASLLVPLNAIELGGGAFLVGLLAATAAFALASRRYAVSHTAKSA